MRRRSRATPFSGFPPRSLGLALLLATLCAAGNLQPAQSSQESLSPAERLEEGRLEELALGDLDRAIAVYSEVAASPEADQRTRDLARFRWALCLEQRGEIAAARQRFEELLLHTGLEEALARAARRHLGEKVQDDPAAYFPPDVLLYVELVDPRQSLRRVTSLLEGTSFQNPVDTYVSSLGRDENPERDQNPVKAEETRDRARVVPNEAAFLNEGFLRELELMKGLAAGLPAGGREGKDFLVVFDPGASNILRGLVQMGLTISRAEPVGTTSGGALFKLPTGSRGEEPVFLLYTREVVLLGRPRELLEESLERAAGRSPSLAMSEDFKRSRAGREEGLIYCYTQGPRLLEALERATPERDHPVLESLVRTLGARRFDSLGLTLSSLSAQDSLRLELRARVDRKGFELWEALATPPLDAGILSQGPPNALAYLATRLDEAPRRLGILFRAFRPLLDLAEDEALARQVTRLEELLNEESSRPLLEALDGLVVGLTAPPRDGGDPGFILLQVRGEDSALPLVERALAAMLGEWLRNAASRSFQSETLERAGQTIQARFVEPLPGRKIWLRQLPGSVLVAFSSDTLLSATPQGVGVGPALRAAAERSGKALVLRPASLLAAAPRGEIPEPLHLLLAEINEVICASREEGDQVALDILVPGITRISRAWLDRVAALMAEARRK